MIIDFETGLKRQIGTTTKMMKEFASLDKRIALYFCRSEKNKTQLVRKFDIIHSTNILTASDFKEIIGEGNMDFFTSKKVVYMDNFLDSEVLELFTFLMDKKETKNLKIIAKSSL